MPRLRTQSLFKKARGTNEKVDTNGTRSIVIKGRELSYTLRRSQRRTLGLMIDHRGLIVSIPLRSSVREAELFVHERASWIFEKLDEWSARPVPQLANIVDGMQFGLLGWPCTLRIQSGSNRAHWIEGFDSRELHLFVRGSDPKPLLLRSVQRYALTYFKGRVDEFGYRLQLIAPGLKIPTLRLTNARTRWGSCSQRSGIRLNWRLIHLPNEQVDYVVAHELAHLLEMNHSARFWAVVARLYPEFEAPRAALNHTSSLIPVW